MARTEIRAKRAAVDIEWDAERVEGRLWFRSLARAGLGARSVIYLLIAYLTADIALRGRSPAPADSSGAFNEMARQPAGPAILFSVAIGLMGYAVWRLVSALALSDVGKHGWAKRLGLASSGAAYLFLCAQAVALVVNSRHTVDGSSNPSPFAATILRWPGGSVLLGLCAVGFIGTGIALLVWGWAHDYTQILDQRLMTRRMYGIARGTGIVGDSVRGLLIGLIGIYVMASAVTDNPTQVKGLGQALQAFAHKPFGVWLLGAVSAGLFSFALYSGFEARFRRI